MDWSSRTENLKTFWQKKEPVTTSQPPTRLNRTELSKDETDPCVRRPELC